VGDVIEIHQKKKFFSLDEARDLLPVVRRVTKHAQEEIDRLATQLSVAKEQARKDELEEAVQSRFRAWMDQIKRLGCEAKGAWLVDFDNGEGYYCWSYPESSLAHFHGYREGFGGRTPLQ